MGEAEISSLLVMTGLDPAIHVFDLARA